MKNILITGGTGFIGINLTKKILNSKNSRCNIYILTRKKAIQLDKNDYEIFSQVKFIKGDIINFNTDIKFDEIYHLAYDTLTNEDFLKYTSKTIIDGLVNIAKLCHNSNTKRLIFLSSGAVYENIKKEAFKTNETLRFNLFNKNDHYGILKAAAEQYLWSVFKNSKTHLSIYRVFATIGPYMRLNGSFIIGNTINNLLKKKPIKYDTDCKVLRNIIHIDDLINKIKTSSQKKNFTLENIIGKNVHLRNFLYQLSKREGFKIKFGNKKNAYRLNYVPFAEKDSFNERYLFDSFHQTLHWFKNKQYVKFYID